ncbi:LysR family transcriptional regulator [Sphingobium sp. BHU LFT2]|uniref:LysR family transcriptional regulator n=1 Tax=Sphingobium sp. BHU LFT2 TaxID=2807634 RepID=UPI001BE9150F|nr:LysR family transcriptional regulator [Sphingobium sp. BHU LFT2]MBT2246280.1 LysR family transcriptional regulator [Sphingobium sp. BHU LFT2]
MNGSELDDILAFLFVYEERSFTAAAKILGRDASVLSRRVTGLEARLGVRLIERSTRHIAATEAGDLYYRRMKAAVTAMEEAEVEVADASAAATGTLRVAMPATFGRRWIAPHLPEFLTQWPALRLEAEFSDRYVDLIEERFDLAIRIGELNDSRMVGRTLAPNHRILVAAPAYLEAKGSPVRPKDLSEHVCLANSRFHAHLDWALVRGAQTETVRIQSRMTTDDSDSLLAAAVAGLGIMVCATWLCATERAEGRLVQVLPEWSYGKSGNIHLIRPSARYTAAKTRHFADWLAGKLAAAPWR